METYKRTRQGGTVETVPANPQDRIDAIRAVVDAKQFAKVDGCMCDLFSASAVVAVYDALSDANKAKFASKPFPAMAKIAFQLIK